MAATMFAEKLGNFLCGVFPNSEVIHYTPATQTYEYMDSVYSTPILYVKEGTR
jgi:hypothetical protein